LATLLGPGPAARGAAAAGAAAGAGAGAGAAGGGGCAAGGAAGVAPGIEFGDIIMVPLKRAAFARGSNSLPQARHLLAWSVTDFPQCGQNAIGAQWNYDRVRRS
jgi:hypothetical protein